jgi:formyl-CoA transferase
VTAPLEGLLVADFSRVLAGPYASATLADLGATVVKVERPGAGDDTRAWGPPWTSHSSTYFESVNRTKLSVVFDFTVEEDVELARELARRADIVIENFLAGRLARVGLDYESVRRSNPGVIYCSISGWGGGAGAERPGYDFIAQAAGGLMSITGEAEGTPTKVGVALVDVLTGKDAVIGILAALSGRSSTGRGQLVQVNLLSSLLASLVNQGSAALTTGAAPSRLGNRHPSIAPYETLMCADGPIAVAVGNDAQFRRLAEIAGMPALADDVRFQGNSQRVAHRSELAETLEEALKARSAAEWEDIFVRAGLAASVVADILGAFRRAKSLGLDMVSDVGAGHAPQVRHPVSYSGFRVVEPVAPPALGGHTSAVAAWLRQPEGDRLGAVSQLQQGSWISSSDAGSG